ncbi:hypothetical protein ACFQX6_48470 [Streptosporangium lutulentum]
MQTAPVSRVMVISQLAAVGVLPVSRGMCGRSGTTSVCMTATTTPQNARTPTRKRGWGPRRARSSLRARFSVGRWTGVHNCSPLG